MKKLISTLIPAIGAFVLVATVNQASASPTTGYTQY